jgi:sugar lactone lactonase YvrE
MYNVDDFQVLEMHFFCLIVAPGLRSADLPSDATWSQNGITVAGNNESGSSFEQFHSPEGLYADENGTVYIADMNNNRIMMWRPGAKYGQKVAGGYGQGDRNDQLFWPKDVIVDRKSDSLIISDFGNHRIVRWPRRGGTSGEVIISNISCSNLTMDAEGYLYVSSESENIVRRWKIGAKNGTVVAGGNGQGDFLDQLNHPNYIFVDRDHSVYVSDANNCRVMKWTKDAQEGIVVAGGQGGENDLTKLSRPAGILVDQWGTLYVADERNDRVMRWQKGDKQGTVAVGGNGRGEEANQLRGPSSLSFDLQGNLYVVDAGNRRVQRFDIQ